MKILVVDDSKADVMIICNILKEYDLLVAYDGLEAMELIKKDPDINIMILSINMPRKNGFEVLEAIMDHPQYRKISTLILTNYDEIDNEIRGLELGALDYIRKPLNLCSLRKRIELHVNLKNAQISLEHRYILTEAYTKELFNTSPLHDIGKVGISDSILLKPGKLTFEDDALVNERVYKPAFSHQTALDIILADKGKHFDPDPVDAFIEIEPTIRSISERFSSPKKQGRIL